MRINGTVKWLVLAALTLSAPFWYTYFMMYWSNLSLPVVQYLATSPGHYAGALLTALNTIGVAILGLLLSITLHYLFGQKVYLAAAIVAFVIIIWNITVWTLHAPRMPNYITIIEWVSVLLIFPLMATLIGNYFTSREVSKSA